MSPKYHKSKWWKTFKILASFGQNIFKSPSFSKILYWINPNNQYGNDNKLVLKISLILAFSRLGFVNTDGWAIRPKCFYINQKLKLKKPRMEI